MTTPPGTPRWPQDVKDRFNAKYFHPDTGLYGDHADSQTAQILPLAVGMVPADKVQLTYQRLLDSIHARKDHVGTGFVALPWLLQTLAAHRESALANVMVNQKDYPSWNTLIKAGVLMETWKGGGAQMPSCGGRHRRLALSIRPGHSTRSGRPRLQKIYPRPSTRSWRPA